MTVDFKNLSKREYQLLLNFPVYVSLLAANTDGKMDNAEKLSAIEFAHIKSYSCDPLLADFFQEVDKSFEKTLQELNNSLPQSKAKRDVAIKAELLKIESLVSKLEPETIAVIHKSMKAFKEHISLAHHNVLIDFLFPLQIFGISDY
ncbi:MAG: hypothetical protein P8O16_02575 [Algoriphagus sp.]|jgi:hypothetical protein|uniref:hypothetical protein n=1 Tax=Algoriphagus sp. TaxID=1872435 RepID=UPI00262ACCD9|nr:hypothetical protein [Algoriphagus sp.]MDG1276137.1 hypothetical protein [Algoriphagus sp.]